MSWWIGLVNPETDEYCEVDPHTEGGNYAIGGAPEAHMNVTYNYSHHFHKALHPDGFRWLNGKTGAETIEALQKATDQLGTEPSRDYWKATSGNAGYCLAILLHWAEQHPTGVWEVH